MTKDRAIRLAKKWSEGGVCTLREGEAEEYHKVCLEALMNQPRCERDNARKCYRKEEKTL